MSIGANLLSMQITMSVGESNGIMAKELEWGLKVSKFEPQLHYSIHFWINTLRKGMNPFIPLSYAK